MDTKTKLKAEIEAFCAKHSLSGSTFSKLATGEPTFWFKFVRGRVPSVDTADKIRDFMATYNAS
jgi:hypothetical protein